MNRKESTVCKRCFEKNPADISLLKTECNENHSGNEPRVRVMWSGRERRLVIVEGDPPIRPIPKSTHSGDSRLFILCDGIRCHGENCYFAHSNEELTYRKESMKAKPINEQSHNDFSMQYAQGSWHGIMPPTYTGYVPIPHRGVPPTYTGYIPIPYRGVPPTYIPIPHRGVPSTYTEDVPIPYNISAGHIIGKGGENIHWLKSILKQKYNVSDLHVDDSKITVTTTDGAHFVQAKDWLEHHFLGLCGSSEMWAFLHLDNIPVQNDVPFKFCKYKGHMLHHFSVEVRKQAYALQVDEILDRTKVATYQRYDNEKEFCPMPSSSESKLKKFCVTQDFSEAVDKLQDYLKYVTEHLQGTEEGKLEARFGRMIWNNLPPDYIHDGINLKDLEELFHSNHEFRTSLNTSVEPSRIINLQKELQGKPDRQYTVDTYHLRTTASDRSNRGRKVKLDVRIMLEDDGTAKILGINKNSQRKYIFDVICPQRQHDFRLQVGLLTTLHVDDPNFITIKEMIRMIQVTASGELSFIPHTKDWVVQTIRHKKTTSYILPPDDTFMVTVSQVTEFEVNSGAYQDGEQHIIHLNESEHKHWEVELCNLSWETEFIKGDGVSAGEALRLYMVHPFVEGVPAKSTLQSEDINKEDLENMFEKLDFINYILG